MNKTAKKTSAREQSIRDMFAHIKKGDIVRATFGAHTVTYRPYRSDHEPDFGRDYIHCESWGSYSVRVNLAAFRAQVESTARIANAPRTGAIVYGVNTPDPNAAPFSYGDKVKEKGTGRTGWVVSGHKTTAEVIWDGVNGGNQSHECGVPVSSLKLVKAWAA